MNTGVVHQPSFAEFGGAKRPADTGVRVADLQHGRRVRQAEAIKRSGGSDRYMAQTQPLVSTCTIYY